MHSPQTLDWYSQITRMEMLVRVQCPTSLFFQLVWFPDCVQLLACMELFFKKLGDTSFVQEAEATVNAFKDNKKIMK